MKRSEMLAKITGRFTNKDRHYEVNTELAELILNAIEDAGMLPPPDDTDVNWDNHPIVKVRARYEGPLEDESYWELENVFVTQEEFDEIEKEAREEIKDITG